MFGVHNMLPLQSEFQYFASVAFRIQNNVPTRKITKDLRMKSNIVWLIIAIICLMTLQASSQEKAVTSATVPMILDHNRALVDAEIQRADGSWRKMRLWIDTGNPNFYISKSAAQDLGIDLPLAEKNTPKESLPNLDIPAPEHIRIGGMMLNFEGVATKVMAAPHWLFSTMHNDGNFPSTVLRHYDVVLDYPAGSFTIAKPGSLQHRGTRASASIHPQTGIFQIDAIIDGDSTSFALDNGASYSFMSHDLIERLCQRHPQWHQMTGTVGCANMWGWWPPGGETTRVIRIPEILWGQVSLKDVGAVDCPDIFGNGAGLGAWYSQKDCPTGGWLPRSQCIQGLSG
jgi:predicted aspartyl protease